jgi:hypothetical protein
MTCHKNSGPGNNNSINYMEPSTYCEGASSASTKLFFKNLSNQIIHFGFHKSPPLYPKLNTSTSYLSCIHFNISTHQRLGLCNELFSSGYPKNNLYAIHLTNICATCLPFTSFFTQSLQLQFSNEIFYDASH